MGPVRRFASLLLLLSLTVTLASAQTPSEAALSEDTAAAGDSQRSIPRVIRFSGGVRGADSEPRSGAVGLTFAIYAERQGGAPLWLETQNVQLDEQGHYSVLLGRTSPAGLPLKLFATGEARWLGVRMAEEGAAEQPRVALVSVPYALTSANAQTLGGRPASDFQLTRAAAAAGDPQAAGGETSGMVSSGTNTVGRLAKFTALDTIGDSAISEVGGRLGLGTNSPGFQIDIQNADASASGSNLFRIQSPSVNGATMHFISTSANGRHWGFGSNFILGNGEFGIYDYTATSARLFIDAAGRIGLGTVNPGFTLDVQNSDATATGAALMRLQTPSVNGALIRFISTSANGHDYGFGSNFILGTGEFGIYDYTANASRLVVGGTGNVGIGTSSPTQKLEVVGQIYSTTGGFRFPDNTVQTTAATGGGVTGSCPEGQFVRAIAGGGVTCATDQTTGLNLPVSASGSTSSGAFKITQTNAVQLQADPTFASAQTNIPAALVGVASSNSITNVSVAVAGFNSNTGPAIVGWNGSTDTSAENDAAGVLGISDNPLGTAIVGEADHPTGANTGVEGFSNSTAGTGVRGQAEASTGSTVGVVGQVSSPNGIGVRGIANNNGIGGQFESSGGIPLKAVSGGSDALVVGANGTTTVRGLVINSSGGNPLTVTSGPNPLANINPSGTFSANSYAQLGGNQNEFNSTRITGTLQVTGSLSKGSGSFKIDHPLDPANKYLYHSFVESPDMMNIYNGNVKLDARGEAWVTMPEWFQALNMDFRYQLTAIGRPSPNLYIAREITGNRFKIAGGRANAKVSWMVTGIRQDVFAKENRIQVEVPKPPQEQGTYLYPQGFQPKPVVAQK